MAVTRTAKKLAQVALGNTMAAIYTSPTSTKTQIVEMWFANTSAATTRKISLAAHGTAAGNIIVPELEIPANGTKVINASKVVLEASEALAAKQDAGADVIATLYGVQEVSS